MTPVQKSELTKLIGILISEHGTFGKLYKFDCIYVYGRGFLFGKDINGPELYQPGITEMVPGLVSGKGILEEVERIPIDL